jgi:hypothetical protein
MFETLTVSTEAVVKEAVVGVEDPIVPGAAQLI